MKKLFKFYWDCGRQGSISGLFIATQEDVDKIIGEDVYFGEVLGKHSEVYGILEKDDIKALAVSEQTVKELEENVGRNISGYNPIDYWEDRQEDEEEE